MTHQTSNGYIVCELLENQFAVPVCPADNLTDTLELDSLDRVEVVLLMEETFGVEIDDSQMAKVVTVQDLIDLVAP